MEICNYLQNRIALNHFQFQSTSRKSGFQKPLKYVPHLICNSSRLKNDVKEASLESNSNPSTMLIMGMGFVGKYVGEQLKKESSCRKVFGTCKHSSKKKELEKLGFDVEIFDTSETEIESLNCLEQATHLLVSVPPTVGLGDLVLYHHGNSLRSRLSDGKLQWICYLSSTSVYGDCGGAWVDEDYPANPTSESAKARLAAEEGWLSLGHDLGVSAQVFRLGGIYGPGRSALDTIIKLGSLTEGQKMREAKQYTSRVHVADIYQAIKASIETPSTGRIYNVVDDDPAPRAEVFAFARALIGKRWPEKFELQTSNDVSKSEIQKGKTTKGERKGEKRVSNVRLKKELGIELLHPSYRSGLEKILESVDYP